MGFYDRIGETFAPVLQFFHDLFVPIFGIHAWGWGIIGLTVVVRVLLLPLAIKQTRSMRAMQRLQPQIKELQKKYKVDRALMRKDPEQYRAKRQKLNQEMMELYRREKANPAASCLPLLAQAPVFVALFATLWRTDALNGQPFYFITSFTTPASGGLEVAARSGGWPGWLLIILMSGTMYWSQRQMMARNAATQADNPMAQQQKILLYAMPIFLAFISLNFPLGILVYWVTTNFWQVAQQAIILREVESSSVEPTPEPSGPTRRSPGASSGKNPPAGREGKTGHGGSEGGDAKKGKNDDSGAGRGDSAEKEPGKTDDSSAGTGKGQTNASNGQHGSTNGKQSGGDDDDGHLPRRKNR